MLILNESFNTPKTTWDLLSNEVKRELLALELPDLAKNEKYDFAQLKLEEIKENSSDTLFILKHNNVLTNEVSTKNLAWSKAMQYARTMAQMKALAELFVQACFKSWNIRTIKQIDDCSDVLISIISNSGFKKSENAFLEYLSILFKSPELSNFIFPRAQMVEINNLWASGSYDTSLNDEDLRGTGKAGGKQHIIFNPNLYLKTTELFSDFVSYIDMYSWLSKPYNVSKLNLKYLNDGEMQGRYKGMLTGLFNEKTGKVIGDIRTVRDILMFKDAKKPLGELMPFKVINDAVTLSQENYTQGQLDREFSDGGTVRLDKIVNTDKDKVKDEAGVNSAVDTIKNSLSSLSKEDRLYIIKLLAKEKVIDVKQLADLFK